MAEKIVTPTLIGIIVDVSNSMRRNWEKKEGKGEPRIETIRDALNKEIKRIQASYADNGLGSKNTFFFCLGMGFQRSMFWTDGYMSYGTEIILDGPSVEKRHPAVVCDILALIDILPTKEEMDELENHINNKWNSFAGNVLGEIVVNDDVASELLAFVNQSLRMSALRKLRSSLITRLLNMALAKKSLLKSKYIQRITYSLKARISKRESDIEITAQKESYRYLENIHADARNIFVENKEQYRQLIESTLMDFVDRQTDILLRLLSLGHPVNKVFDTFQEDEVRSLAYKIYHTLNKDVETRITTSWFSNRTRLKWIEKKLGAKIDYVRLKSLTEESIKKLAWDTDLRSFAHNAVSNLFRNTFEKKAKSRFSDWIGLSASREVIKPISQISNLLPDVFEHEVYSEKFMFGYTPIHEAINLASLRFMEKSFESYRKILVLISDGEFGSNSLRFETDLLRNAGVTIISCFVSDINVMKKLPDKIYANWPEGARIMFNISSPLNVHDDIANSLVKEGFEVEPGMKLLFQVNYSDRLERMLKAVLGNQNSEI
jgi:hypothetical protein